MRLHVLTAVTRPQNLDKVGLSLMQAATGTQVDVRWHLAFDPESKHVGGQGVKNRLLNHVQDGWVWILDDDTLVHPDLLECLQRSVCDDPTLELIVVGQQRADGTFLHTNAETIGVGHVDMGQGIMRRSLIGEQRIPELYEGDGIFLAALAERARKALYLNDILSFHNAL